MCKAKDLEIDLKKYIESTDLKSLERIYKFQNTENCYDSFLGSL